MYGVLIQVGSDASMYCDFLTHILLHNIGVETFHRFVLFCFLVVERLIVRGQNRQMCHSLRCRQIDMSTVNQLVSTFPNNAERPMRLFFERVSINSRPGITCTCNRESKLVERLQV